MTQKEKDIITKMFDLFAKLPAEKQYYLLGYAQAEADKKVNERK